MSRMEFGQLQTADLQMKKVLEIAKNVATSRAPVLIEGPSGTGKELIAQYIHQNSHRRDKKYMAVNCAALPEGLLESELFGYEKGAFTGAYSSKPGKFELANGGTFLLDEISEMPLLLQAKLLRVLQELEVERVGGQSKIKLNVRIISTTNKSLRALVDSGKFREDLYYRLNVICLRIPALKSRKKDIEMLSQFFTNVSCVVNDRPEKKLSPEAMNKLLSWAWPGNVRELENTIERSVLLSSGSIISGEDIDLQSDLSPETSESNEFYPGMKISLAERKLILSTLQHTGNNRSEAARLLGISIRTLRNKLNAYKEGARE